MRCPRCGNDNLENNRFCGMCGATLLPSTGPKSSEPQPVSVSATAPAAQITTEPAKDSPRSAADNPPSISVPSFLGLADPGRSAPRKRARLSIDPHAAPGSNLDYLLDEEDEQPHHWGIGKILLLLIALALAVGFGYLRWKNQGLAWLNGLTKPAAVAQNSATSDATSATPTSPGITPDSQTLAQPAVPTVQPAASNPVNAPTGNAASSPAPPTSASDTPPPADTPKSSGDVPATTPDKATAPADNDETAAKQPSAPTTAAPQPAEKTKPTIKAPIPKPSPATRSASPRPASYDPVTESQKYIYGRGASQDCDRGMRLLKPEANKSNPKAMIEMGALYSAGLCTPRDLPTAYRWFAMALRKNPDNLSVQADLQKLWGEMTPPERQLAIKLTQ